MDATLENPSLSGDIKVIQELKHKLEIAETTLLNQIEKNKLYEAAIKDKNDLIKSLNISIELIDQNKELIIKQLRDEITDLQNALNPSKNQTLSKDDANPAKLAEFERKTSHLEGNISQLMAEMTELKSKMREKDAQIDEGEPKEKLAKIEKNTSYAESFESTDALIDFLNCSEWPNIKLIKIGDRKMPPLLENFTTGGDWMVILRRFDGSQDFSMNSCSYEKGFGSVSGEFWLGLESIHQLTSSRQHELFIEIVRLDNRTLYARYDNFVVGSKEESYALKSLGAHLGNANYDALNYCKDGPFVYDTTLNFYWWLPQRNVCCLTGKYRISTEQGLSGGMYWYFQPKNHNDKGEYIYVKACKMLIRPKL